MAAPADILSLRHQTQNKNTFTKKQHDVKRRATHLKLYLQELKDRERRAQEHNSQLLQQFEEAQDALKEMLAHTAAMKTIRREYERYLEDNSSRWQQKLQQQTQAAQIKRTVDSVSSYLRKTEEKQALACTADTSLLSQGPSVLKSVAPQVCSTQENSNYNQDISSYHPHAQPSWLTSSFLTASRQSHDPLLSPPHTFLHPLSFLPQHFTFTPSHQPRSRQDDAGEDPEPCAAGTPAEEPPASRVPQTGEEPEETSGVPNSNREQEGGNCCLSPDLDIKPVRLLSHDAGSSESDRDSSLVCRGKTKNEKRGRTRQSSSDSASHASQRTANKTAAASFLRPRSSESDTSSEEGNAAPDAPLRSEAKEQSHADESESSASEQESGRSDRKNKTSAAEETDDQEQSGVKEKDGDGLKNPGAAEQEETENSQSEEDDDDEEVSLTGRTEEEAEVRMEDEVEEKKQGSASSQEEEDESSEDEEGSHDEDQGEETGEESGDSEDVIISPQNKRPEQIQIISDAAEDEENKSQSSKEISDEDIENLLVPPEPTEEMDLKANEEPKVIYHNMDIFQVAKEKSKTGDKSDSDEFDHFYD